MVVEEAKQSASLLSMSRQRELASRKLEEKAQGKQTVKENLSKTPSNQTALAA